MIRSVLVPIADGSEELEAVTIIDVLRRACAEVTVASVGKLEITASRNVKIIADKNISECVNETYDLIVLPGGMPGAETLRDCKELEQMLKRQAEKKRLYAAICASPVVVLQHQGLLIGHNATCHPAFAEELEDNDAVEERVVIDGNCITSRAPGTAMEFALKLVELLYGEDKVKELAKEMLVS